MNSNYEDFIGIYDNVYPEGYCQHLIQEFERLLKNGAGINRQRSENAHKHNKNDIQMGLNIGVHDMGAFQGHSSVDVFFQGLQRCYEHYAEEFSVLKDARINATAMKMQRTDPGGGYHLWHAEQGNRDHASRVLVYMVYLNTLEDGAAGETEFLYQKKRYVPTENRMILWPAAYTHAHRGNTVFGTKSKYIVTGWFYYE